MLKLYTYNNDNTINIESHYLLTNTCRTYDNDIINIFFSFFFLKIIIIYNLWNGVPVFRFLAMCMCMRVIEKKKKIKIQKSVVIHAKSFWFFIFFIFFHVLFTLLGRQQHF